MNMTFLMTSTYIYEQAEGSEQTAKQTRVKLIIKFEFPESSTVARSNFCAVIFHYPYIDPTQRGVSKPGLNLANLKKVLLATNR